MKKNTYFCLTKFSMPMEAAFPVAADSPEEAEGIVKMFLAHRGNVDVEIKHMQDVADAPGLAIAAPNVINPEDLVDDEDMVVEKKVLN